MPPMTLLATAGLIFLLLAVGGLLAQRIGQSVIPAYILAGVLVGPFAPSIGGISLALVDSIEAFRVLSELGVVLLLFFVGLELSLDELITNRTRFLKAGAIDVGISIPLGVVLGLLFGFTILESFFVALIVFNSSTVIIAKSLLDLGWIANPESKAILGVVVLEDIVTAVLFAILSILLLAGGTIGDLLLSVGQAFLFLGGLTLLAYYGSSPLTRLFEIRSPELFLLAVLGATGTVAGLGLMNGVSEAVAAFLVGTAFGRTTYVERIEDVVASSRDLFAAVFFFAIGAQSDPALLVSAAGFVAVAVLVTIPGQLVSGFLAGRSYGLSPDRAVRVATALAPRGEFSLVIAAFLVTAGTSTALRETIPAFTVGYVLVTSILGTILMRRSSHIQRLVPGLARVESS